MSVTTLSGDYGYKEYWVKSAASGTTYQAIDADWHIAGNETVPAINIFDSKGIVFDGGEIWGEVSLAGDWANIYNHMATGFRVSNSPNTVIRNFHIDQTWDGIRFIPDDSLKVSNGTSNGWLVEDVLMTNIRDDAIENDFAHTGTVRDSLFDGVFSAFGTVNDQSAHGVLTVDDSIIIMKDFLKDGEMVHGSPFKFNTENPANNPDLRIFDTIIAVQDPTHNGMSRLKEAWANLTESSGNYYLNLSDTPFPAKYPLPPKGFTILQGKEARDFLASEKAKWLAEHDGAQTSDPTPTEPTPEPTPEPDKTTSDPTPTTSTGSDGKTIVGTSDQDVLIGTEGNDVISGKAKGDFIYGKGGSDVLTGGTSWDKFVFDTKLDGSVDTITDFQPGADAVYLDSSIFTKLGGGSATGSDLDSSNFVSGAGAVAKDANDFIIYNRSTGELSYDADGSGSGAAVVFAKLSAGLSLDSGDIRVLSGSRTSTSSAGETSIDAVSDPVPNPDPSPAPSEGSIIEGTSGKDVLIGTSGDDQIEGKAKGDFIYGKGGSDVLTGGTSWDKFVFDTALDGSVDTITDFDTSDDFIYLDNSVFSDLGSGSMSNAIELDSDWLVSGPDAEAADANDCVLYDSRTGELAYDADGSGSGAAVTFADLSADLDLSHTDILIC